MSVTVTALAGVGFFLATGFALTDLVPSLSRRSVPARLGYAYLLGIAWTAGGLYAASHVLGTTIRRGTILPIALLPVAAVVARRLSSTNRPETGSGSGFPPSLLSKHPVLSLLAAFVPAFVTAGLFADAVIDPVKDWDGRMTWVAHARFIRQERTVSPRALVEAKWYVANPEYPVLMPLAQVAVQETFSTNDDERVIRPLYAAFYPAFLLVLFEGATRLAGRRAAIPATLVASVLPVFYFETHGGARGCYSDLPLGCFFGAGLFLLLARRLTLPAAAVAGLLLGAAVLTKAEGLFLALAAVAIASLRPARILFAEIRMRRQPSPGKLAGPALAAAGALAATALYASWRSRIPNHFVVSYAPALLRLETWHHFLRNVGKALPAVSGEISRRPDWGFFWVLPPLLALAGKRAFRRRATRGLVLGAASPVAIAVMAYGVSELSAELAGVTFNRFLIQGALPLFGALAMCLREVLKGQRPRARGADVPGPSVEVSA